jgi:hypothetical protein
VTLQRDGQTAGQPTAPDRDQHAAQVGDVLDQLDPSVA